MVKGETGVFTQVANGVEHVRVKRMRTPRLNANGRERMTGQAWNWPG